MMRIQPEKRANEHEQNATCCYLTNNNISQTIQVYRKDLLAFPFFFFSPRRFGFKESATLRFGNTSIQVSQLPLPLNSLSMFLLEYIFSE